MKKEVFFAIVFGIIVGLVVMFGIYTANNALQQSTNQISTPQPTPSALKEPSEQKTNLTILSPEDNLLTDKGTVPLSGKTLAEATVIIFVNGVEHVVYADQTGSFSFEIPLEGGSNVIETIVMNKNGEQSKDTRTVVYSNADLEAPPATSSAKQVKANTKTTKEGDEQ